MYVNTANSKERQFWNNVFSSLFGSTIDEENRVYTTVYRYEINRIMIDVRDDLAALLDIYGAYYTDDVAKIFAIYFYDTFHDLDNTDALKDIAVEFDSLYCNNLGDKPNKQGVN